MTGLDTSDGPWFRNESFWRDLYPVLFPREQWAAAPGELDDLLALIDNRGTRVLDLCCGPGRHSLELARRGFQVTGVDASDYLIARARQASEAEALPVEWVVDDMRRYRRDGAHDLALNLFTSFGYFEDPHDDLRVLRNVYRSLTPGGTLVLELASKEWIAGSYHATTSEELEDGTVWFKRHELIDDWSRIRVEWTLVHGERARSYRFEHRLFSGTELKGLLRAAGFRDVRLHGDYEGTPFGLEARRLVAIARRGSESPEADVEKL